MNIMVAPAGRASFMTATDTKERRMADEAKGCVIVTGGSRGIGAAICRKLAAEGYPVALSYTSRADLAQAIVTEITAAGGRAVAIGGDVAEEADIIRLFAEAQAALGPLYGLVNNAGIVGGSNRLADLTAEALHRTLAVNVAGTVLCAREAVRVLSTKRGGTGGAIVNMASVASRLGGPGELVHYATSKGAIDTFTIGLAREVAAEGIRVNAVAPGLIDTEMNSAERQARIVGGIPMQRVGTAAEVAEAVAWLLNPAASYVTGTIVTVSGGR
jgi:NAD(P)-dependent dehydrogenase (short-subunit alcohol dehydrogenase family)